MGEDMQPPIHLEADYLVIGAGVSGLAFVDELINTAMHTSVIIVDKHTTPGGHWNDAYKFVTLQMPAVYYGVNSLQLGEGGNNLSSHVQLMVYFENVMKRLLATKRVTYFPQCQYVPRLKTDQSLNETFHSLLEVSCSYTVKVCKKLVDATLLQESVPSCTNPPFSVADGVNFVPVNGLFHNQSPWKRYVIIGGGKTSIDAILFLLSKSVDANCITWIVPNDRWIVNRSYNNIDNFAEHSMMIFNSVLTSANCEELFSAWEKVGFMIRLDTNVNVAHFEGASASLEEVEKLRLVNNVVRKGRVARIEHNFIFFEDGSKLAVDENTLHINCAGSAPCVAPRNIFNGKQIILQRLNLRGNGYSAVAIAAIEVLYHGDDEKKNALLKPVGVFKTTFEFVVSMHDSLIRESSISWALGVVWSRRCRLNVTTHISLWELVRGGLYALRYGKQIMQQLTRIISNDELT